MYNIVVVTGSRAEYGIMKPLMKLLDKSKDINLKIIVCAMHMEEKYGYTYKDIEDDGFDITLKIPMNILDTSDLTILKSMSILQDKLAKYYSTEKIDLTLILGDRYEMLSVVNVSVLNQVPICHLHGGEKTLGNYDEFIRHSITKMSHIHLTATDEYKKRVIQLGEDPKNVYNVGSLGVENVLSTKFYSKLEIEEKLKIQNLDKYFVVLFHPVTLESKAGIEDQTLELLNAIEPYIHDNKFIFIGSNSDSGSDKITIRFNEFISKNKNAYSFKSLPTTMYHSLVKSSRGLIGNSSSGLIEVPSLGVCTINIGNRQEGRVQGNTIINVNPLAKEINKAISELINLNISEINNPYYKEGASENAYNIIMDSLEKGISIKKDFYDIDFKVEM